MPGSGTITLNVSALSGAFWNVNITDTTGTSIGSGVIQGASAVQIPYSGSASATINYALISTGGSSVTLTSAKIGTVTYVPGITVVTACNKTNDFYRYGFNGQMKNNEWAGVGNYLDFKFRGYNSRTGRFISVDPLFEKYPWNSDYAFAANKVINSMDLEGLEAVGTYNKATGTLLLIPDISQTKPSLPYRYVDAFQYAQLSAADKSKSNYGIAVTHVFTGAESSQDHPVPYRKTIGEIPIPNGQYNILENKGVTGKGKVFFALDPQDKSPYNKVDDRPGEINSAGEQRSGYELHPGSVSYGCITINKFEPENSQDNRKAEWGIIRNAILNTKTKEVPDNRGWHKYMPGATQIQYGTLQVIDKPAPGQTTGNQANPTQTAGTTTPAPATTTITNP